MRCDTPAIGQRFMVGSRGGRGEPLSVDVDLIEVVGVVEDGKYHEMQESPQPVAFLSLSQNEQSYTILVVRSRLAQNEMALALERTLSALAPSAQITVQSWPDALGDMLFPARAATITLGVMGLLAAMLAATGILRMAAHHVSRGVEELGIRVGFG